MSSTLGFLIERWSKATDENYKKGLEVLILKLLCVEEVKEDESK